MTTPPLTAIPLPESDAVAALHPEDLREYVAPLARAMLAYALALGIAADLLLRRGFTGLGYPAWLTLVALSALSLVWRGGRRLPREAAAWLGAAIVFGFGMSWHDAPRLQFLDFLATLLALGMAAIALGDARAALLAGRLRDTAWAAAAVVRSVAVGVLPLAFREIAVPASRQKLSGRFRPALRAAAIALPLLIVFGSLLRGADPVFASILALPDFDLGTIASHLVLIGFFGWVVAGWARAALIADIGRHRAPERLPWSLSMLDVTSALGVLDVLFALYVVTQLGWFFGGERFLQERTGLTAAQYARQGFFHMVCVVLLTVPVLLGTRATLRPGREIERRHTALALPIVGLLGVMIVSAVLRMRLYVHYFGLTTDRLYPLVFMGWLALVLAWLVLTVLRGRGRWFVAGALVSGLVTLVALNVVVPEVVVARANIARSQGAAAGSGRTLDVEHLVSLGGEAVPLVVPSVLAGSSGLAGSDERIAADRARCNAASVLLGRKSRYERMAEDEAATWRYWNRGRAEAARVVRENQAALRAVQRSTCTRRVRPNEAPRHDSPPTAPAGT